jgi:hypothetical protein
MARASTRSRAWLSLLRKRPKQRAAGGAYRIERLIFLISRVGQRSRALHVLEHLFHVRADHCLTAAFPELHFGLLSIHV